jgi:uncharacterized protein (TIGR02145 family)
MKSKYSSLWVLFFVTTCAALGLVACGDTDVGDSQEPLSVVSDVSELPDCTAENAGDQAMVKGEPVLYVCVDGEWTEVGGTSNEGNSCKTVELKDKSGLKIICDGDSVGVVKNGVNGENGASSEGCSVTAQTDSTVTITCGNETTTIPLGGKTPTVEDDPERQPTSLDSLVGVTQKGPFLKGSTVYLYELESGRTLKQTNGNFTSNITSEDGRYKFTARDLVSQYAMVVVDGYYRNEVTGRVSDNSIRLNAYTDLSKHISANVNLLTHLEFDRVYYLVTKKGKKLYEAKRQAQKEILKLFDIELANNTDAEDMNVFGKTDADAALLALSVLLQGDRTESDMMALLAEISNAIAEKGEWKNSTTKAQIALWAATADGIGRLDSISNHVKGWGLGNGDVPPFEKHIRNFYGQETGLGTCGADNPLGTKKALKAGSDTFNFVCEDVENGWWRLLTKLDLDTAGWGHDFEEGTVRNGKVNANLTYVFENGNWRHGTSLDSSLGLSCIPARKDTLLKATVVDYYKCVSDTVVSFEGLNWHSVWRKATNDELDMDYWEKNKNENGRLLKSSFTGRTMVWDADTLREPSLVEQDWNRACVKYMYADKERGYSVEILSNGLSYTCSDTGWSRLGWFDDNRDYKNMRTYKGVKIGKQTWMAENLKYSRHGTVAYYATSESYYFGYLYTWASAMDSEGIEDGNVPNNCGFGSTCTVAQPVRGVCPERWHLPSKAEWETLFNEVGGWGVAGKYLKSKKYWNYLNEINPEGLQDDSGNGLDTYSFSAYPGGLYLYDENRYDGEFLSAHFWTSTEYGKDHAYSMILYKNHDAGDLLDEIKNRALSVRCVKD